MNEQRRWLVELKWWLSAYTALMAVLLIFALIRVAFSLATIKTADLAVAGITDPYGDALGQASWWVVAVVLVMWAYLFAAALSFRLLVPTFAGAPPRAVGAVLMTWPVALGAYLFSSDLAFTGFFVAIALAWAITIPLPKRTVLTDEPIKGGAVVGLALGTVAEIIGLEWAILWCALRLYRGKSVEVAATGVCAAILPALFLVSQLPHASRSMTALYLVAEILILGGLSMAGFLLWLFPRQETDPADEPEDEPVATNEALEG